VGLRVSELGQLRLQPPSTHTPSLTWVSCQVEVHEAVPVATQSLPEYQGLPSGRHHSKLVDELEAARKHIGNLGA
jgi:hypothetical protein